MLSWGMTAILKCNSNKTSYFLFSLNYKFMFYCRYEDLNLLYQEDITYTSGGSGQNTMRTISVSFFDSAIMNMMSLDLIINKYKSGY